MKQRIGLDDILKVNASLNKHRNFSFHDFSNITVFWVYLDILAWAEQLIKESNYVIRISLKSP